MIEIPIDQRRMAIDDQLTERGEVCGIQGVVIHEKRDRGVDRVARYDCVPFCLGMNFSPNGKEEVSVMDLGYFEVDDPFVNDLAVYIDEKDKQVHVGKSLGGNRILSKWNYGHIYLHDAGAVPSVYGEVVRFFRKEAA